MTKIFDIALPIALGAVFLVLVFGIINLFRSDAKARSRSNQLMRLRVALQFVAILVLMGAFWFKTHT